MRAIDVPREEFCVGCFTGNYPVPVQMDLMDKLALEQPAVTPSLVAAEAEILPQR